MVTLKKLQETDEISFNSIFYLHQYVQHILISPRNHYKLLKRYYVLFLHIKSEIQCVFYIPSTLQLTLATLPSVH